MSEIYLIEPLMVHEKAAKLYIDSYRKNGEPHINGSNAMQRYDNYMDWLNMVNLIKTDTSIYGVTASTYFTMRKSDDKIIGTIQLRHYLNEDLRKCGGHIGYGICPTERKKGYGTKQLELVLLKAREMGIPKIMISYDKDNFASAKVAINNGGVLEWEGMHEEDGEIQIFWIDLT